MDFKQYVQQKKGNVQEPPGADQVRAQMSQFEGKSEQELMSELMRSVEQGKQDGSFTPEAAEAFMKKVSPMLDDAQRARMRQLMGMLKK